MDGLEEMQPIFRQVNGEWSNNATRPFIFHVHASKLNLCIDVSDFYKNTFQAIKSIKELEDMRDMVGIGGPWTEFVEYLKDSLTSEDLKLVLEGQSKSGGSVSAKVISQKSEGLPTISVTLTKLVEAAASEAIANINLELLKQFKNAHTLLINEQQQRFQLSKILAAEQEKNRVIQGQLEASSASRALASSVPRQEKNQEQVEASSASRALASFVPRQEKNQDQVEASSGSRAFSPSVSRQEKNGATRREPRASHALVPISIPEKNHSTWKEHDPSPASRTFSPSISHQENNYATPRELHASTPTSRTFSPSVSHQEKSFSTQRQVHASSPTSRTFCPSVSHQEKSYATQRQLHAPSPTSRTFSPSVSCQEKNDTTVREKLASPPSRSRKLRKIADLSPSYTSPQYSSEKQRAKVTPSFEVTNRVIPSYRRQNVEGIVLLDSGDELD